MRLHPRLQRHRDRLTGWLPESLLIALVLAFLVAMLVACATAVLTQVLLGAVFLAYAWKIYRDYSDDLARKTFRYSIVYLSLLFAALLIDHYARVVIGA